MLTLYSGHTSEQTDYVEQNPVAHKNTVCPSYVAGNGWKGVLWSDNGAIYDHAAEM